MENHRKLYYGLQTTVTVWVFYSIYNLSKLKNTEYWMNQLTTTEVHNLVIINTMISTFCLVIITYFVLSKIAETVAENMKQTQK